MPRWFEVQTVSRIESFLQSKCARPTVVALALFLLMPVAALAQGSPFDTGFTAIQSLFTGTIVKVASLAAIVIGGYGFAHGEPGAKKALAGVAAGTGICCSRRECPELALGCIALFPATVNQRLDEGVMPDKPQRKHRTNRVFSLYRRISLPLESPPN